MQNAIFFYCGVLFCLRGGAEHRELKYSQFELTTVQDPTDSSQMTKCVIYSEFGSKNHQGSVHQVHLDNKIVTHYADESLGDRCFVSLFELYRSKLPDAARERDIFYCKPKTRFFESDEVWYCNSPVGHNILSRKLKDLFIEAGLSFDHVQNHSLRATGINRLYSRGIQEKAIMERSGHHSVGGVRSYKRSTDMQKKDISSVLISNHVVRVTNSENQEVVCQGIKNVEKAISFNKLQGCTLNFTFNYN